MCVCVTGVQRGPARGTEFKFQIWSVSQGVTVCIALPAGSNSLHRWCVFELLCSPLAPRSLASPPVRGPLLPLPFSRILPVYISRTVPLIPAIYLSISIFHIIQTREVSDLIDRRKESPRLNVLNWSGIYGVRLYTLLSCTCFSVDLGSTSF